MSDETTTNEANDDAYVLEDTGESLSDFDLSKEEARTDNAAAGAGQASGPELDALREENNKLKDQFLRSRADFENFRRRAEREKSDYFKFALTDVMRELLPVLDNFERALTSTADSTEDLKKGVELIYKQLGDALTKYGLTVIDKAPAPFDPAIHEAVTREENTEFPSHTVIDILQKGYFLNERLIRPALVRVAVGGPAKATEEPAEPSGE